MAGPQPGSAHPRLSPARRRVLQAVADLERLGQVTLAGVAAHLGGHPNTSRQQLDALVREGFLDSAPIARSAPGRRPLAFLVTPRGQRALDAGGDEYRELVGAFASYLVHQPEPTVEARRVGDLWGAEQASTLAPTSGATPLEAVVEVLDILGFEPAPARTEAGQDAVVLTRCPLLDAAGQHPEVVCEIHAGLIDGVLRRLGKVGGVELLPFADPHGCLVRLDQPPANGGSTSRRAS